MNHPGTANYYNWTIDFRDMNYSAGKEDLDDFDPSRCGHVDEHYSQTFSAVQFWLEGIFFMAFGIVGLVGALVTIAVLATKDLRAHLFNQLLIALSIFDILFIVCSVPVYSFPLFNWLEGSKTFYTLLTQILYPMSPVTLNASIFMTLALTVERYLAVCMPIRYRDLNMTMSTSKRVAMYVLPVVVLSIALNIPKFMEATASVENDTVTIEMAEMRRQPTYVLYFTISQLFHPTITTGIAPMVVLIYMNVAIFAGIRKSGAMGRRRNNGAAASAATTNATNAEAGQPANRKKISENNLAFVLISIVVMHFICHILRVFMAIYSVYLISDTLDCLERGVAFSPPLWSMCSDCVASLLLMVNFSGNFLIYCSALKSFRGKLKQIWQTSSQKTNGTRRQSRQQVRETDGGSAKSRNSITIANGATLATTITTIPEGRRQDNAETSL